jgi:hypothetical protein
MTPNEANEASAPVARRPNDTLADDVVRVLRDDNTLDPATDPKLEGEQVVGSTARWCARGCSTTASSRCSGRAASASTSARSARRLHPRLAFALRETTGSSPATASSARALARDAAPALRRQHVRQRQRPGEGPADAGSLHVQAGRFGSVSSPIGTQITQAAGFAWAAKIKKEDVAALVLRRRRDELERVPQRDELRGRVQGARRLLLPQQRLGDQRAHRAPDRERHVRGEGRRLRRPRRARRRQRSLRGDQGHARRRPSRGRARRGPDADRGAHVPPVRPLDERRSEGVPPRRDDRAVARARPDRAPAALRRGAPRLDDDRSARSRPRSTPSSSAACRRRRRPRPERSTRCSRTSTRRPRGTSSSSARSSSAGPAPRATVYTERRRPPIQRPVDKSRGHTMPQMNMVQAINDALRLEMRATRASSCWARTSARSAASSA